MSNCSKEVLMTDNEQQKQVEDEVEWSGVRLQINNKLIQVLPQKQKIKKEFKLRRWRVNGLRNLTRHFLQMKDQMRKVKQVSNKKNYTMYNETLYEVERVVQMKWIKNRQFCYIKWKGYDERFNTWEPKDHITFCYNYTEQEEDKDDQEYREENISYVPPNHHYQTRAKKKKNYSEKEYQDDSNHYDKESQIKDRNENYQKFYDQLDLRQSKEQHQEKQNSSVLEESNSPEPIIEERSSLETTPPQCKRKPEKSNSKERSNQSKKLDTAFSKKEESKEEEQESESECKSVEAKLVKAKSIQAKSIEGKSVDPAEIVFKPEIIVNMKEMKKQQEKLLDLQIERVLEILNQGGVEKLNKKIARVELENGDVILMEETTLRARFPGKLLDFYEKQLQSQFVKM